MCVLGTQRKIFPQHILFYYFYFFNFIFIFYLVLKFLFIYLFLAALGPRYCVWAFASCSERGLFFITVRGLLIAVASLVVEHGL